jgi:hypothetical protein
VNRIACELQIQDAKRRYFQRLLAPYVHEGILDTVMLKAKNPKLYEETRLAYKGIRSACVALGYYQSAAAKKRAEKDQVEG